MSTSAAPLKTELLRGGAVALGYYLTASLGLKLALVGHSVTLFWMPSGIALAGLILFGSRMWPAVFIGALLANLSSGLIPSLEIAAGATLAAFCGNWLLQRQGFKDTLAEYQDIFLLLLVALVSALISALSGTFWLAQAHLMEWDNYFTAAIYWWMGDALGVVIFTPLLLSWWRQRPLDWTPALRREAVLHIALMVAGCTLVFSNLPQVVLDTVIGPFILLPLIVWGAMRFNMRHTLLASSLVFFCSVLSMIFQTGAFAPVTLESIRELWIYNLVMGITALFMSASSYHRRRSIHALERIQSNLNRAQAVAVIGSWSLDIPGDRLECSDEAGRIFGIDRRSPLSRQSLMQRVHPDDVARVSEEWEAALRGHPHDLEYRIVVGGQTRWLRGTVQIDFDRNNRPKAALGVVRDITPRKRAEEAHGRSQQMLQSVLDAVPVRIFWKDPELRFLGGNYLFLSDLDLNSVDQLLGKTDADFYSAEQAAQFESEERQVIEHCEVLLNHDVRLRDKGGRDRWLQFSKVPLLNTNSDVIGVLTTYLDITERKKSEETLRLAAKVFESSSEAILITDAEVKIVAVNQALLDISGFRADELMGRNPNILASGKHDAAFYQMMWADLNEYGHWEGEIEDKDKSGRIYPKLMSISAVRDDDGEVSHYVSISRDITERKQAEQNIHRLAFHDMLTGLPNRTLLRDRLEQLLIASHRTQSEFAVLFMDLDRFKYINDSMGHAVGDKLLQAVAGRIEECVREGDTVARLGGDEFVVLLRDVDSTGAGNVATKLLGVLAAPYYLNDTQVVTHASIGVSLYPQHAQDSETLIKNADMAMYRAKEGGRNNFQFFAEEMNFRANNVFSMEKDLREAQEIGQFMLYYQPQVDLTSGKICGAEALIRWKHPTKGFISPAEFIPVAEETGQIIAIGEWVLRTACEQLAAWRKAGLTDFTLAVNLSMRQLLQPSLVKLVTEVLEENQLQRGDIELEITEGIMMGDTKAALHFLEQMRELGVQLSIDDFGTGFSSLSYLKRLPVDKLKIDQSFVRDIEKDDGDAAIVRAIISLGHRLNLEVIAEGVETLGELDFLRIRGCDQIQGYYFSRPLPADEFEKFVRSAPRLP